MLNVKTSTTPKVHYSYADGSAKRSELQVPELQVPCTSKKRASQCGSVW
jgi:hypothetical protein